MTPGADEPEFDFNLTVLNGAVTAVGGAACPLGTARRVLWGADGSTLIGFADHDGSGTFRRRRPGSVPLTDNGNGTFKFDLKDQLDHSACGAITGT